MLIRGAIYGLSASAIWGGMYVVSDIVLGVIPPFTLLSLRLVMGVLVLLPFVWRVTPFRQMTRQQGLALLGVGVVGFGFSVGAQFVGTDKSTAMNGSLITSASPAFIVLFAVLLLRERLTLWRLGAIALATVGVLIIINPANAEFGSETFLGDVVLAFAALTWGLYSVLVRRVSANQNTLTVTWFAFLGGLCITLPASILELPSRPIGAIDGGVLLGILYLGVVSTAVAMWLWNRAFALVEASIASLFFFAQPLVGALLSTLVLAQPMTPALWVGGALIGVGVVLALFAPQEARLPQTDNLQ